MLAASLAILSLAAAATAAPAPAPATAIVGEVKCTKIRSGQLELQTNDGGIYEVQTPGSPPTFVGYPESSGKKAAEFEFYSCPSSFMGTNQGPYAGTYDEGTTWYYGQLRRDGKCARITSRPQESHPSEFTTFSLEDCYFSDDSGQIFWTWKLEDHAHSPISTIKFIDARIQNGQGGENYIYYLGSNTTAIEARPTASGDNSDFLFVNQS